MDVPQFQEESVGVVTLVPRERVQWTDEQMEREFFDMFTCKKACLAGLHELRTQMEVGRHYFVMQAGWNVVKSSYNACFFL